MVRQYHLHDVGKTKGFLGPDERDGFDLLDTMLGMFRRGITAMVIDGLPGIFDVDWIANSADGRQLLITRCQRARCGGLGGRHSGCRDRAQIPED